MEATKKISRRELLKTAGALGALAVGGGLRGARAQAT